LVYHGESQVKGVLLSEVKERACGNIHTESSLSQT
jgi:hypothetical protein